MRSLHSITRRFAARFLAGTALLGISALGWPSSMVGAGSPQQAVFLVDLPLGMIGFLVAIAAVGPLTRLWYGERDLRRTAGRAHRAGFDDASLPRRVFQLLLAVARADGQEGPAEREMVRSFLLARFLAPEYAHDLRHWEAEAIAHPDVAELAARIALSVDHQERATLFTWACLVAFADGTFRPAEHTVLQQVARGLGLAPDFSRLLFAQARENWLRQQETQRRWQQRQQQRPRYAPEPPERSERQRALDILGLDASASPDIIRRRHRELVKRFHPDAQPNLGAVAQQEATDRFRAIQHAYEVLSS